MTAGRLSMFPFAAFAMQGAAAAQACASHEKSKQLPMELKMLSRSKLGPAELVILSSGKCTRTDMPAAERSLGPDQPEGVFSTCEAADAVDTRGK